MLKRVLALVVVVAGLALVGIGVSAAAEVQRVTKEDLKAQLNNPTLMVLDVRAEKDWKKGNTKIAGAVREDPKAFEQWGTKYPKDKALVLYCA